MEASIQLPGRGDIEGFWPGFWAMGNLGRPGYPATTDGLWPYSYWDKCDYGITANQSAPDGLSLLPGMRLPACTCANQDHPSAGISRSAPEIDALEASVGFMGPAQYDAATGTASQSLQVAPFDIWYQPDYNYLEIYDSAQTSMNAYRGGVYQEALSGVTWLNNNWYEAKGGFQTYGFEYTPGDQGKASWFVGNQYTWSMDYRALRPNGNIGQRVIPQEPMSIIANFGMSNSFAQVFLANLAQLMPATMRLDYIRIYQAEGSESVTCDPPGYPTTDYIKNHPEPYANPNLTLWYVTIYFHFHRVLTAAIGLLHPTSGQQTHLSIAARLKHSHSLTFCILMVVTSTMGARCKETWLLIQTLFSLLHDSFNSPVHRHQDSQHIVFLARQ